MTQVPKVHPVSKKTPGTRGNPRTSRLSTARYLTRSPSNASACFSAQRTYHTAILEKAVDRTTSKVLQALSKKYNYLKCHKCYEYHNYEYYKHYEYYEYQKCCKYYRTSRTIPKVRIPTVLQALLVLRALQRTTSKKSTLVPQALQVLQALHVPHALQASQQHADPTPHATQIYGKPSVNTHFITCRKASCQRRH